MKDCRVSEMKNVMEAIMIRIFNIVRQRFADKDAVPSQITLSAFSLGEFNFKSLWESFIFWKVVVENRQIVYIWIKESPARFHNVTANDLRKV